jgi:hypothetical protein
MVVAESCGGFAKVHIQNSQQISVVATSSILEIFHVFLELRPSSFNRE